MREGKKVLLPDIGAGQMHISEGTVFPGDELCWGEGGCEQPPTGPAWIRSVWYSVPFHSSWDH